MRRLIEHLSLSRMKKQLRFLSFLITLGNAFKCNVKVSRISILLQNASSKKARYDLQCDHARIRHGMETTIES
jgi:hypothetical protein